MTLPSLTEIETRTNNANDEIDSLCAGTRRWTMSIPAKPATDSDLVISASLEDVPALTVALRAVLELHKPVDVEPSDTICRECSFQLSSGRYFGRLEEWPCPTVQAITEHINT